MAEAVMASPLIKPVDPPAELARQPLVLNQRSPGWLSDTIAGVVEGKTPKWWWAAFIPSVGLMGLCFLMIGYLISTGVGVWGVMHPVMWGWAIVAAAGVVDADVTAAESGAGAQATRSTKTSSKEMKGHEL